MHSGSQSGLDGLQIDSPVLTPLRKDAAEKLVYLPRHFLMDRSKRFFSLIALFVLGIAQMGVHLVFFLHITTGPDNVNNLLALAFGVLIVLLLIVGSLWIMSHLNHNMMPMDRVMQMQR